MKHNGLSAGSADKVPCDRAVGTLDRFTLSETKMTKNWQNHAIYTIFAQI